MREIKFRAWDEGNRIMHNDLQFIKSGNDGNDWILFTSDKQKLTDKPHPLDNPFFQQQLKIMQFTGFTDKNGNEIYEDDVLVNDKGVRFRIIWDGERGSFVGVCKNIWHPEKGMTFFKSMPYVVSRCALVGNVYDNSNLLKS